MLKDKHIFEALANINEGLDVIKKDQQGHGYKFRGINQVFNALKPLIVANKIVIGRKNVIIDRQTFEVVTPAYKEDDPPKTKTIFRTLIECDYVFTSCVDGSEFVTRGFGEGIDNASYGDKSSSMATSNAFKYVVFEMFAIAVEEQEDSDQVTAKEEKVSSFAKPEEDKTKFASPKFGKTVEKPTDEPVVQKEPPKEVVKEEPKPEKKVEPPKEQTTEVKQNIEQKKSRFARS